MVEALILIVMIVMVVLGVGYVVAWLVLSPSWIAYLLFALAAIKEYVPVKSPLSMGLRLILYAACIIIIAIYTPHGAPVLVGFVMILAVFDMVSVNWELRVLLLATLALTLPIIDSWNLRYIPNTDEAGEPIENLYWIVMGRAFASYIFAVIVSNIIIDEGVSEVGPLCGASFVGTFYMASTSATHLGA